MVANMQVQGIIKYHQDMVVCQWPRKTHIVLFTGSGKLLISIELGDNMISFIVILKCHDIRNQRNFQYRNITNMILP